MLAVKEVSPCGGHPGRQCTQGGFVFVFHTRGPRCGVFGVSTRGDLVVACLGVHARGPRCGVFGVSMRGGLVVACLGVHTRGLVRAGCETQWLQSGVHKLSSEHVHQLSHATSVATFKARVAPKRDNDAGLGPPGATAHQEVVFQVQVLVHGFVCTCREEMFDDFPP